MPQYASKNSSISTNSGCIKTESAIDWTYYYRDSGTNKLLFAIAKDPYYQQKNNVSALVEITTKQYPYC
jgi:hypothetical protein